MTLNEVQPQQPVIGLYTDRELLIWALERITEGKFTCEVIRHDVGVENLRHDSSPDLRSAIIVDYQAGVLELIRNLSVSGQRAPIIVWQRCSANEPSLNALDWGAAGILHDSSSPADVLACLNAVTQGAAWIPDSLAQAATRSRRCRVSRREEQLIRLVVKGLRNKEIACALKISEGTMKVYFSRLFKKLGVSDRYELALLGLRHCAPDSVLRGKAAGDPTKSDPLSWLYVDTPAMHESIAPWGNVAIQFSAVANDECRGMPQRSIMLTSPLQRDGSRERPEWSAINQQIVTKRTKEASMGLQRAVA